MKSMRLRLVVWIAHGRGSKRAISRSNSRNVMATRKNFMEKGNRADPIGSKPHSYGLTFSAYVYSWGSQNAIRISSEARAVLVNMVIMRLIILFWVLPKLTDWKSVVLFNTKRIGSSSVNRYI